MIDHVAEVLPNNATHQRVGASGVDFKIDPTADSVVCDCYPPSAIANSGTSETNSGTGKLRASLIGPFQCTSNKESPPTLAKVRRDPDSIGSDCQHGLNASDADEINVRSRLKTPGTTSTPGRTQRSVKSRSSSSSDSTLAVVDSSPAGKAPQADL